MAEGLQILFDRLEDFNSRLDEGGYHIPMEQVTSNEIKPVETYKSFKTTMDEKVKLDEGGLFHSISP